MNKTKKHQPCGSWPSSFTPAVVAGKNKIFSELQVDQENTLYWLERRPEEQGRTIIVQWKQETGLKDVTDSSFSIENQVHEYGGGSYAVNNHCLVFSDLCSNGLWLIKDKEKPVPIYQKKTARFADFCLTDSCIICVHEDHSQKNVTNSLVLFSLHSPGKKRILVEGADFYSSPRLSTDQKQLVWIEWNHPFMPWESTLLCMAEFNPVTETLTNKRILAGHLQPESLIEPGWTKDNRLIVCSDRTEWWNLYQVDFRNTEQATLIPIAPIQAEIGKPQWVLGQKNWYSISENSLIAQAICQETVKTVYIHHPITEIIEKTGFDIPESCPIPMNNQGFAWINHSTYRPMEILYQDHDQIQQVIRTASNLDIPKADISIGKPISFPTKDHQTAYAFFYPPVNSSFQPCHNELPPLLVLAHGGPTGQSLTAFSPKTQFWTSRGFAVVDVNYRGSTGFGRPYRNALKKQWGILDVQDCIDACHFLIAQKLVDPDRIVIKGSSAGGFTVLQTLIQSSIFAAGSCLYGVGDLTAMAKETHKFESHYLNGLIGDYPEEKERYHDRSPLTHIDRIRCPIILFQGLKDKVVPPAQTENMIRVLKKHHVPYAYYQFAEEGHGFKQEITLKRVLELELSFFGKILGFTPCDISEDAVIHR